MREGLAVVALAAACVGACSIFALDGFSGEEAPADASTPPNDASGTVDGAPGTDANDATTTTTLPDGATVSKYHAAVAVDAPYAHFTLDETSGAACASTVATSVVCVYPSSDITRGQPGIGGTKAVHLDAATAAITAAGVHGDFSKAMSIELWIRLDTAGPSIGLVEFAELTTTSPGDGLHLFTFNEGAQLRNEVWFNKTIGAYALAPTALTGGAWHHVVYAYAPGTNGDLLYLDGVQLADADTFEAVTRPTVTKPFSVSGFIGLVDELAFYDHVLAADRVAAHYAAQ